MKFLGEVTQGRDNNFNLIRMVAAVAVLVAHAWPLSLGPTPPWQPLLHGMTAGDIAVLLFFSISGFLVCKSFVQSNSSADFLASRGLRIFPGLFFSLVLTAYGFGLICTSLPKIYYLFKPYTARFVLVNLNLLIERQYILPGVFAANPFSNAVNGSLWTLRFEVYCYLALLGCGIFGLLKKSRVAFCILPLIPLYLVYRHPNLSGVPNGLLMVAPSFAFGMLLYIYRNFIPMHWLCVAASVIVCCAAWSTSIFFEVFSITLSYCAMYVAYMKSPTLLRYNSLGDYSYGVYIYAFPIQQVIVHFLRPPPLENIFISIPIVLVFAACSWHFVEQPALRLKHRIFKRPMMLHSARSPL